MAGCFAACVYRDKIFAENCLVSLAGCFAACAYQERIFAENCFVSLAGCFAACVDQEIIFVENYLLINQYRNLHISGVVTNPIMYDSNQDR